MNDSSDQSAAPSDLVTAVVNLVATGPVPLGAYTRAEIAAVGGMLDWLEQEPGHEPMAEAVRSLAAPPSARVYLRSFVWTVTRIDPWIARECWSVASGQLRCTVPLYVRLMTTVLSSAVP